MSSKSREAAYRAADLGLWNQMRRSLNADGYAILPRVLTIAECRKLSALYGQDEGFRTKISMARHGFGRGEYKYFSYPLPDLVERLRHELFPRLAPIANEWNRQLGIPVQYPDQLEDYLIRCHEAGQTRPTPLLLQYGAGDYNCLHQDLYGDHVFPLQVAILLSCPRRDFAGGEFVMTESSSKRQRAQVVPLGQGDAVIFTVNQRPAIGTSGRARKVAMRHGVSQVREGQRHTIGLIFHDSR